MAKGLIEIALQLGSKLGANTSKFLGTRSNVSFLGTGPKDGMLFQKAINPESFATIGIEKVIPDIESSLAYATGGKLNDIELSTLIKNLKTMDETLNPTNIVDMGGVGIDSLRAKSGLGERQLTEAASDVKSIDDAAAGVNAADTSPLMSRLENTVNDLRVAADDLPPPGSRGGPEDIAAPVMNYGDESASGIMATIDKVDLPGKRAASREFLVNSLKVGDEASSTTLSDVMSAQDMKYIMEGGGGVMGDPIVLVQKYFGPRIAEMVPVNASSEEIAIFTRRVMNNVEDAKGFRPDEPEFDAMTETFVDNLDDVQKKAIKAFIPKITVDEGISSAKVSREEEIKIVLEGISEIMAGSKMGDVSTYGRLSLTIKPTNKGFKFEGYYDIEGNVVPQLARTYISYGKDSRDTTTAAGYNVANLRGGTMIEKALLESLEKIRIAINTVGQAI